MVAHLHAQKPKLKYTVKWVGYDETTGEPEENLDNCPEELETYFKSIGGKPQPPSAKQASTKKRPASENATSTTSRGRPAAGANKKQKTEANSSQVQNEDGTTWKAPSGSWETHIMAIDSMIRDDNGELIAFVIWNNSQKSRHPTKLLNFRCPQKMLQFYEAHLFVNLPPLQLHTITDLSQVFQHRPSGGHLSHSA